MQVGPALLDLLTRLEHWSDTPGLDAQVLLAHILNRPRAWLLAHPDQTISPSQGLALREAVARLEPGEPLPYLLGHWEFYGLDFTLTPAVLVPRPETELLVENALQWLGANPSRRLAADVGAGSGCIGVSLAVHIPDLQVIASDISLPALRVAKGNAQRHQVAGRLHFVQADLLPSGGVRFDLICANLPYIPTMILKKLQVYGKEPDLALDGGVDGLDAIRRLVQIAPARLSAGGRLLMEIESSLGQVVRSLTRESFPFADVQVLPDLAGHDRLVVVQTNGD